MSTVSGLPNDVLDADADGRELRTAVAAYLSRFKGLSRTHADSDLRAYLNWCSERRLHPLAASRPHVELYVRWMQEIRRLKPSTTSRRVSIVARFYRTAVIDGLLEHSPADHVRGPQVPPESPTLGLTHLQLEALLTAARHSENQYDFALVCLLGLLGLRVFEATGLNVTDLGEEHGHRVLRALGKGGKTVLVPLPPAVGRALDQAVGARYAGPILLNTRGARMDRHAATRRLHALAQATGMRMPPIHPHTLRHTYVTTMLDAGVDLRDVQIAAATPTPEPRCAMTEPATSSTATPTTSSPPTWPPAPNHRPARRQAGILTSLDLAEMSASRLPFRSPCFDVYVCVRSADRVRPSIANSSEAPTLAAFSERRGGGESAGGRK